MIVIGIDPGVSGGIAFYSGFVSEMTTCEKMPPTESELSDTFVDWPSATTFAYIERVHSSPQMGVKSAFTFGQNYGFLRGCLVAHGIPFEEVRPQQWMREFGMKKSKTETPVQWKNRLKGKAQQLFPHLKVTLATADALLICEYGRRLRCQPEKR